jgi:hypothetical protein
MSAITLVVRRWIGEQANNFTFIGLVISLILVGGAIEAAMLAYARFACWIVGYFSCHSVVFFDANSYFL